MDIKVTAPSVVHGEIRLPFSKSISNRVLLLNKLSKNRLMPENVAVCDDSEMMRGALAAQSGVVNTGAAGTATRFSLAYLSMLSGEYELTGSERMKQRPIKILVEALRKLGADIEYLENEGYLPLKIKGKELQGGEIELSGGVSSQYISALLMIAPYTRQGVKLTLTGDIISLPYIKMTISLMSLYGAAPQMKGNVITVPAGRYNPLPYKVEADWSAASYWYGFVALAKEADVILTGLDNRSIQGDSKVASLFTPLGVATEYNDGFVRLRKCNFVNKPYEADLTDTPDLAQTLVVAAVMKDVHFKMSGLQSLRIKETDRISALVNEMRKLGFVLDDSIPGTLIWNGERCKEMQDVEIDTYDDHRMAMSFAIASYLYPKLKIKSSEVVTKSYPTFWDDLLKVGFEIER
ncbi:MAG: 3-phosphoshikimate 1-carboxyvinyltransferase [Muribaculaceae bacterium]|nr:3-phosphoshikimate 1-carboxyvinyltransferase [Muribaculaceae bacterium]